MSELYCMISITDRDNLSDFSAVYQKYGIDVNIISLGRGTASDNVAEVFGLTRSEKAICFSIVTDETWKKTKKSFYSELHIDYPGMGIVVCVPVSSIGGIRELNYLTDGQNFVKGEESVLKNTDRELLVVICNQGFNRTVMEAARTKGALGGTVLHATGTGIKKSEQFFGVSLATEKEVLFIVVNSDQKKPIMEAIMKEAGVETKAKSVVFSLPVIDSAGLRHLDELLEQSGEEA